jgi:hypothetical protein
LKAEGGKMKSEPEVVIGFVCSNPEPGNHVTSRTPSAR